MSFWKFIALITPLAELCRFWNNNKNKRKQTWTAWWMMKQFKDVESWNQKKGHFFFIHLTVTYGYTSDILTSYMKRLWVRTKHMFSTLNLVTSMNLVWREISKINKRMKTHEFMPSLWLLPIALYLSNRHGNGTWNTLCIKSFRNVFFFYFY